MLKVSRELFLRELVEEFGLGASIDLANAVNQLLFVHVGKYRQTALFFFSPPIEDLPNAPSSKAQHICQ